VRSIFGPYLCGDALDVRRGRVLTGAHRGEAPLQMWDLGSGRLATNLPYWQPDGGASNIYSAKFVHGGGAKDGCVLAGGSGKRPCARLYVPVRANSRTRRAAAASALARCSSNPTTHGTPTTHTTGRAASWWARC